MANIMFGYGKNRFIATEPEFLELLGRNRMPRPAVYKLSTQDVLTSETRYTLQDREVNAVTFNQPLPEEYAVAGWLRWLKFKPTGAFHLVFRLA